MSSEPLLSSIIPFAGSGLLGYAMGFALKKVMKWMLTIVGFVAGMFFVGVQLLQKYGYVSTVNWDKLGNDTSTHANGINAAKLFQLFIEKRVVTIDDGEMSNAFYNYIRIRKDRISVYQPFELLNF
jgi:uncharacterized membrane protein (Fun14 family)